MRNSLKIQENILKERKRKTENHNGKSEIELINWANNLKNYRR